MLDWPLPIPVAVLLLHQPADRPLHYRGSRSDIQVFPYPFDKPEVADLVDRLSLADMLGEGAGKYCEFVGDDRSVSYLSCPALIDALHANSSAGKGISFMIWVALDQFGYVDEAAALYRSFEKEMGTTMAAMGMARLLLKRRPQRSLQWVEDAQRRGLTGAAMSACHARVLFACGQASRGTSAAALALKQRPDPDWKEADHQSSWGLLHGAAQASVIDTELRRGVLPAIQSLVEGPVSARRLLACAELSEAAADFTTAARHAEAALHLAAGDDVVHQGADTALQRIQEKVGSATDPSIASKPHDDGPLQVAVTRGPAFNGVDLSDLLAVQNYCRRIAESEGGSLVEAEVVHVASGRAIRTIYKKQVGKAFHFTGVQLAPLSDETVISTVAASEGHLTGSREAAVTMHLLKEGQLTMATYQKLFARDPYDASYKNAAERQPLRFISDDVVYDRLFAHHPLARVRRALANLSEPEP
ncbi:MAG TPA: hypothetical protein VGG73_13330 [Vicinamibacterales bacterium]